MCHRYWPKVKGDSETFGKCTVTLTSLENYNDYIIRKMEILENNSRMSVSQSGFTVSQFQCVEWPEDGVPLVTTPVLEITNLVQKVQMGSGNKAIVVMCKYVCFNQSVYTLSILTGPILLSSHVLPLEGQIATRVLDALELLF